MKEIMMLTKVLLNANFGFSQTLYQFKTNRKKMLMPVLIVLAVVSLLPAYYLYISILDSVYMQLFLLGQEGAIFAMTFSGVALMVLFFGLIYVMSTFYFSKDMEQLLYLPLKEESIITAKFINMIIYEYLIVIPFLAPVFVTAYADMGGLLYTINFIIGMLLVPVIPLSIAAIVVMSIMKFINISGKKDLIRTISLFLMLGVILGVQLLINQATSSMTPGSEGEYLAALLRNPNSLVNVLGRSYPPAIWMSKALYQENISAVFSMILFIAASAVFFAGAIFTGKSIYIKGYFNKNDAKKKTTGVDYRKGMKSDSTWEAIFKNDMRLVMRTPIYMFNCVSVVVLIPLLLILMPFFSGGGDVNIIAQLYGEFKNVFTLVLIGLFVLIGATNPTASTTFSREGKSSWITVMIPAKRPEIFIGRMIFPLILQVITMLFILVPLIFLLKLSLFTALLSFIVGLVASLPTISFGILIDGYRPKLEWDDPQKAVKQNLNVVFSMFAGMGFAALMGFISILLFNTARIGFLLVLILVVSILLTALIFSMFKKLRLQW
ncbi:MAG: hypothetical protein HGA49_02675 [Eubacteriaceae bacterium]|nr:hypothetical protein [Eubacteriaceae bacterium]